MLNVTRVPANYRRALGAFKQSFRDERNFTSFVHMACALIIVQAKWTVSDLSERLSRPDEKARRTYNRFFTGAAWNQTALAQALLSYVWSRLSVDNEDTLLLYWSSLIVSTRPDSRQTAAIIGRGPGVYALVTACFSMSASSRNEAVPDTLESISD